MSLYELSLEKLDYARNRIQIFKELPDHKTLLEFLDEVEYANAHDECRDDNDCDEAEKTGREEERETIAEKLAAILGQNLSPAKMRTAVEALKTELE